MNNNIQTNFVHNSYFDLTNFLLISCLSGFLIFCLMEQRLLALFTLFLFYLNVKLSAYINYIEQIINYPFYAERIKNFKPTLYNDI